MPEDHLPDDSPGDRLLTVLLVLGVSAFALMLIWLVVR
jgi:hypothetical protein